MPMEGLIKMKIPRLPIEKVAQDHSLEERVPVLFAN